MSNINKFTKTISRVSGIFLRTVDISKLSLEVVTEFTEKEITEKLPEKAPKHSKPQHGEVIEEKILRRWENSNFYPMRQVSIKELVELRLSKIPGIVYKKDNSLFYAEVPGTLTLNGKEDNLGKHACGHQCTMVCKGCPRTSALTVAYQQRIGKSFPIAVKNSWRIEKYDFVREGLESFNMNSTNDAFIVLQCENYQMQTAEQRMSKKSTADLKAGLASYIWDDFHGTRTEMLLRIKENERKNK